MGFFRWMVHSDNFCGTLEIRSLNFTSRMFPLESRIEIKWSTFSAECKKYFRNASIFSSKRIFLLTAKSRIFLFISGHFFSSATVSLNTTVLKKNAKIRMLLNLFSILNIYLERNEERFCSKFVDVWVVWNAYKTPWKKTRGKRI